MSDFSVVGVTKPPIFLIDGDSSCCSRMAMRLRFSIHTLIIITFVVAIMLPPSIAAYYWVSENLPSGKSGIPSRFGPPDPKGIVRELNEWSSDELEVYNEPDRFPNRALSGETAGWVTAHEKTLTEMGVEIE